MYVISHYHNSIWRADQPFNDVLCKLFLPGVCKLGEQCDPIIIYQGQFSLKIPTRWHQTTPPASMEGRYIGCIFANLVHSLPSSSLCYMWYSDIMDHVITKPNNTFWQVNQHKKHNTTGIWLSDWKPTAWSGKGINMNLCTFYPLIYNYTAVARAQSLWGRDLIRVTIVGQLWPEQPILPMDRRQSILKCCKTLMNTIIASWSNRLGWICSRHINVPYVPMPSRLHH